MKKWFIILSLLLICVIAGIYIFIPDKLEISETASLDISSSLTYRTLSEEGKWTRWWPGEPSAENAMANSQPVHFFHNGTRYTIVHKSINVVEIELLMKSDTISSTLLVIPLKKDSTVLFWRCALSSGSGPFAKVTRYQQAKKIKESFDLILDSVKSFLLKPQNRYNIFIDRNRVTDTLLVTNKIILDHYPSPGEVYSLVGNVKKYVSQNNAKETNYPMLHVMKTDSSQFKVMVAIPVNKALKDSETNVFKRMVPGNILVTTVTGGRHTIEKAFAELELYISDNKLTPPAIPFESLVTDRLNEPDTSKWVTRIYYPIF